MISEIKKSAYKGKGSIWMPLVLLLLVCTMKIYSLFINNVGELRFVEVFIVMVAVYAIGLILFGFLCLLLKNRMVSGLIASLSLFLFMNFSTIYDAAYKSLAQVHVGYISYAIALLIALLLSIVLLYLTRKSPSIPKTITIFLLIVLTTNIIITTVFAVPGIMKTGPVVDRSETRDDVGGDDVSDYDIKTSLGRKKPNLYFIITDEYASFPCLKKYYHYDNADFYNFLTENKFSVSETSYSYSHRTYECLTALASLRPLEGVATTNELKEQLLKKDNLQYQLLEKLGYDIQGVASHIIYPFKSVSNRSILANVFKSTSENGDNTLKIILDWTMLYWLSPYADFSSSDTYATTESVIDYFANGKYLEHSSQTAYFCYILSPHVPFTHDEHGNEISTEYRSAWGIPEMYLGQLKYTTNLLKGAIENILENDPGGVIILQSDHGVRHHTAGEPPHTFVVEEADTRSIFNAVYFSGELLDVHGLSAVNTWRLVFSKLGVDMDLIDDTNYKVVVDVNAEVMDVQ